MLALNRGEKTRVAAHHVRVEVARHLRDPAGRRRVAWGHVHQCPGRGVGARVHREKVERLALGRVVDADALGERAPRARGTQGRSRRTSFVTSAGYVHAVAARGDLCSTGPAKDVAAPPSPTRTTAAPVSRPLAGLGGAWNARVRLDFSWAAASAPQLVSVTAVTGRVDGTRAFCRCVVRRIIARRRFGDASLGLGRERDHGILNDHAVHPEIWVVSTWRREVSRNDDRGEQRQRSSVERPEAPACPQWQTESFFRGNDVDQERHCVVLNSAAGPNLQRVTVRRTASRRATVASQRMQCERLSLLGDLSAHGPGEVERPVLHQCEGAVVWKPRRRHDKRDAMRLTDRVRGVRRCAAVEVLDVEHSASVERPDFDDGRPDPLNGSVLRAIWFHGSNRPILGELVSSKSGTNRGPGRLGLVVVGMGSRCG